MGSNPMQKMKRNSILIGIIIGLAVGVALGLVAYLGLNQGGSLGVDGGSAVEVIVLNKDIKSGTKITEADVTTAKVAASAVPANRTNGVLNTVAKIDLSKGTVLTTSMLSAASETVTDDLRMQEYNMIALPTNLATGNFIDIRLQLPNGGDYIVVSKKKVVACNASTIWLNMYEEEIELLSNAIIEYYIMDGSKLYATTYTDPGLQTASTGTYVPNSDVVTLINSNPNIKTLINSDRYSDALKAIRNGSISTSLSQYYVDSDGDGKTDALENIETKLQDEIKSLEEARQAYFNGLNAANY